MTEKIGIIARIRQKLFKTKKTEIQQELMIEEPQQAIEEEIVQGIDRIELPEQMHIIRTTNAYMEEFVFSRIKRDPALDKGFALQNEIFVSSGDETVYRSNMEVFFQDSKTGERKITYLVSLVKFAEEEWRVFQVKEVMPSHAEI